METNPESQSMEETTSAVKLMNSDQPSDKTETGDARKRIDKVRRQKGGREKAQQRGILMYEKRKGIFPGLSTRYFHL